jgi:hypothetical protein
MKTESDDLIGDVKKVYKYLQRVRKAHKQQIIKENNLSSEEQYFDIRGKLIAKKLVVALKGRRGGLALTSANDLGIVQTKTTDSRLSKLSEKAKKLWELIPEDGSFVTNLSLRNRLRPLGFSTEDFWKYRKELLDVDLIQIRRGRGGSVARVLKYVKDYEIKQPISHALKDEAKYYEELRNWLEKNRVADIGQSGGQAWAVITGKPGKWKRRSGRWSRPDVVLVEVTTYEYLIQREVVVTTYEIKKYSPSMDNSWVFEAASHSKGAHYSYLVVGALEEKITDDPPTELSSDLNKFGIGFGWLYFNSSTNEYEFKEVLEPDRGNPVPEEENELLKIFAQKLKPTDLTAFKHAIGKT